MSSFPEYYETLRQISDFLLENRGKTDYVLNCFYQQENFDLEEMTKAEGNISQAQKFELRMQSKKEQVDAIKLELSNFKNEHFKVKVAELLYWMMFIMDPPKVFEQKFPSELKTYLSNLRRFENDVLLMAAEVNKKFKMISLTKQTPAP